MTTPENTNAADASLARGWWQFIHHYLPTRWVLLLLGALALAVGAYLNWGWLVALGVAPVLLALAPCAIMCALGLCAMKMIDRGGRQD